MGVVVAGGAAAGAALEGRAASGAAAVGAGATTATGACRRAGRMTTAAAAATGLMLRSRASPMSSWLGTRGKRAAAAAAGCWTGMPAGCTFGAPRNLPPTRRGPGLDSMPSRRRRAKAAEASWAVAETRAQTGAARHDVFHSARAEARRSLRERRRREEKQRAAVASGRSSSVGGAGDTVGAQPRDGGYANGTSSACMQCTRAFACAGGRVGFWFCVFLRKKKGGKDGFSWRTIAKNTIHIQLNDATLFQVHVHHSKE